MGFIIKIEGGAEPIEMGITSVQKVAFETDTPDDSNARSTDVGMALRISGRILTVLEGGLADASIKMSQWSLVPSEKADCYRKVTVKVISADQVVREIYLSSAFVVEYKESYGDTEGVGTYSMLLRQKKDLNNAVTYKGGFAV